MPSEIRGSRFAKSWGQDTRDNWWQYYCIQGQCEPCGQSNTSQGVPAKQQLVRDWNGWAKRQSTKSPLEKQAFQRFLLDIFSLRIFKFFTTALSLMWHKSNTAEIYQSMLKPLSVTLIWQNSKQIRNSTVLTQQTPVDDYLVKSHLWKSQVLSHSQTLKNWPERK